MSYEALARRCQPRETLTARVGAVADPSITDAGPITPLRPTPTVTTKADIAAYSRDLIGLINSFSKDDVVHNMVFMSPDEEFAKVQYLCQQASGFDGCTQCLTCPGWRKEDPEPTLSNEMTARKLRQEAFQHQVNQRWMEDQIDARHLSKAQWQAEVAYASEWDAFRKRFSDFLKAIDAAVFVKESDFQAAQHYDVEFQQFRRRYTAMTGLKPTKPLPDRLPEEKTPYLDTIKAVSYAAIAVGGAYLIYKIVGTHVTVSAEEARQRAPVPEVRGALPMPA